LLKKRLRICAKALLRVRRALRSACKPHSVGQGCLPGWSSIWAAELPPQLGAAYPRLWGRGPRPGGIAALASAWPCSRRGLPGRAGYPTRRWALTPPFHPCPHLRLRRPLAVCFCGPVRGVAPSRVLPGAVPCGVRTFLGGLSRRDHPAGLRPFIS